MKTAQVIRTIMPATYRQIKFTPAHCRAGDATNSLHYTADPPAASLVKFRIFLLQ